MSKFRRSVAFLALSALLLGLAQPSTAERGDRSLSLGSVVSWLTPDWLSAAWSALVALTDCDRSPEGVSITSPTATATGAQLEWVAYENPCGDPADDIVEYQVHRSREESFTPGADTLVAPLPPTATNYLDTTAEPTPGESADPVASTYHYLVAVKTRAGELIPGPSLAVELPKVGYVIDGAQVEGGATPEEAVEFLQTTDATYYAPYTPAVMIPGDEYVVDVTLTNTTATTWPAATHVLSYRWTLPDGTDVTTGGNRLETALPTDLAPGDSVTLSARVRTPIQSDEGNKREGFVINWDLLDTATGRWLSESDGIPPLAQPVTVEDPTSSKLGLEKFYQYAGKNTGAGTTALANLYDGNVVWGYNAFSNPSRGLATFVRFTYNSKDTSASSIGHGWSLTTSTLHRMGSPLVFHPPGQEYPSEVTLIDGDGTSHVFTLDKRGSSDPADWEYERPAGVHLYLQKNADGGSSRAWVMTRPDRTQFFFDEDGYQTAIVERNGNTLEFTYEERRSNNKPVKFLKHITDPASRQTLTLDYYEKGQDYWYYDDSGQRVQGSNLTNPKIIDQVETITDVTGRTIALVYTDEGLLAELTDGAGTALAKQFRFAYDAEQGNKNVKLVEVTDPRGNSTSLTYFDAPEDPKFKWSLRTLTDRLGHPTTYEYVDPDGPAGSRINTTVTDAEGNATVYHLDGFGRLTDSVNAKQQTTRLGWDDDHNVVRLEEANGAVSTWRFDPKTGYPLEIRDAQANADGTPGTTLAYRTSLNGFVADLIEKRSPEGRTWRFGYDPRGNLLSVTDPKGVASAPEGDYTTRYTYDDLGRLTSATDANEHVTRFDDFDAIGNPRTVIDAAGHATTFEYDERGDVLTVTDAKGKRTTQAYDIFGRPLDKTIPKDQDNQAVIVVPAPVYDANDNVVRQTAANGAITTSTYDAADRLTSTTGPADEPGDPPRTVTYEFDRVGNLLAITEPKGNLTPEDADDFVTRFTYNEVYQRVAVTDAAGGVVTYEFDSVDNLTKIVDPVKNGTADPDDFTATFGYDLAHRPTSRTDAAGHTVTYAYDRDGVLTAVTDEEGFTTEIVSDERGVVVEERVPHREDDGTITHRITRYEYDEVGNRTRVITPRGVETPDDPNDFVLETRYDELNRVIAEVYPFDKDDPRFNTPEMTTYHYDEVGNLVRVSAPPSEGQTVRNDTTFTYYDNGWLKTSTDPWDIVTTYDYNELGLQTSATLTSAGGSSSRVHGWSYYPDGKLRSRTDEGVPVGRHVVLVDNSDLQHVTAVGTWDSESDGVPGRDFQGFDYRIHEAGQEAATFTWDLIIPQDGTYEVSVRYAQGTATEAEYTIEHAEGTATATVDQTQRAGEWVSLGSFDFDEAGSHSITLTAPDSGTVVADAVKLVRDNSNDVDTEHKAFEQRYDANGNLIEVRDLSSNARVDVYRISYDELNRVVAVEERSGSDVINTTSYTYDANSNPRTRTHDDQHTEFEYDARDLVTRVVNAESPTATDRTVTTFAYTPRMFLDHQIQGNGNRIDYEYYLDGLLKRQVQEKSDGTLVAEHLLEYGPNGHVSSDTSTVMNADDHADYLDEVREYEYDPRDRIAKVTKRDASSGDVLETESYVHDANSNVIEQTIEGTTTTYRYDRNRLQSATASGATSFYNYDPFGRLDTVTFLGTQLQKYVYDGFDRVAEHRTPTTRAEFTYDPFDRTSSRTKDGETTIFNHLGITSQVLSEEVDGELRARYQFGPYGERLAQIKVTDEGETEHSFYGYNAHSDVEVITDEDGNTRATYGYTAYGENDQQAFTGVDAATGGPGGGQETEPYNSYRFNGKRWDEASGNYDMGFRDYSPSLNRFLTRDLYNGALADLALSTDPWTNNRYAFAAGNPVTFIELDGHLFGMSFSDIGHAVLDVAGMVPVIGEVADVANGIWYAAEGDWVNAGLSFAGAIPLAGNAATAAKWGLKYGDEALALTRRTDDVPVPRAPDPVAPKPDTPAPKPDTTNPASPTTPSSPPRTPDAGPAKPAPKPADPPPSCPVRNSFTPDTQVVMADGSLRRIADVTVGDRVLATDPRTGETQGQYVVELIDGDGPKRLVEVTATADGDGDGGSVVATEGHPFWVENERVWRAAKDLRPGDMLRTSAGTFVQVTAVRAWTASQAVHNLTVAGDHTYYVAVGDEEVLVHNCGIQVPYGSTDLSQRAIQHRLENPDILPTQNVGVARTRSGELIPLESLGQARHSEVRMKNEIGPGDIVEVYTEREPCGVCATMLNSKAWAHVKVTWSFPSGDPETPLKIAARLGDTLF